MRGVTGPKRDWATQADEWAAEALAADDPTGWFERLYAAAAAGEVTMPWDHRDAHPLLRDWTARVRLVRGRAVVVGCGLGGDAEHMAGLGLDTTGFDISPTAIEVARRSNPGSRVTYVAADLFDPPPEIARGFDLVVEVYTVQALPERLRLRASRAVSRLVAPGGRLLVISAARLDPGPMAGPPWPLSRVQLGWFATTGLVTEVVERFEDPERPGATLWRASYQRRTAAG